ncbi:TetR/AcrR family transcriptional regulator [Telmatobacter bradus]|uniref:TetR/AcrR family transcriptional regulator n=1 Tax=Telmatobacter bradus TaxID=474953 RepID=UPI003B42B72D
MVYRKTAATEARKDARRKLLLDAATRMFGDYGYHGATVPMIVAEANSSVGSFYMHFRNKEDIFAAVLVGLGERISDLLREVRTTQSDPVKRISQAVESLFLFLAENPREARIVIVESSGLSARLEKIRRTILQAQAEQTRHTISSAPDVFFVYDALVAARCLVGAVYEALCSWLEQPEAQRLPVHDVARYVADYNTRALLKR